MLFVFVSYKIVTKCHDYFNLRLFHAVIKSNCMSIGLKFVKLYLVTLLTLTLELHCDVTVYHYGKFIATLLL